MTFDEWLLTQVEYQDFWSSDCSKGILYQIHRDYWLPIVKSAFEAGLNEGRLGVGNDR